MSSPHPASHPDPEPAGSRTADDADATYPSPVPSGALQIFVAFSKLALSGFGGVMPFAYRALVERERWLTPKEFAGLLAIAQVMPGPNICNLSVMVGQRFAGLAGAVAALAGMVVGPALVVLVLGALWQRYGGLDDVRRALNGMSAVAIGLILATAVKMGINLFEPGRVPEVAATDDDIPVQPSSYWSRHRVAEVVLCLLGFVCVGVLRWPLVYVVGTLGPIAVALSWRFDR